MLLDISIEALRSNDTGGSVVSAVQERILRSRASVESKLAEIGEAFRAQGLAFLPDYTPTPGTPIRKANALIVQRVRTMRREGALDWVAPLSPEAMPNLDDEDFDDEF